jgi:hypothetical protein
MNLSFLYGSESQPILETYQIVIRLETMLKLLKNALQQRSFVEQRRDTNNNDWEDEVLRFDGEVRRAK